MQLPGAELYYEAVGDGVPVMLVHEFALDRRMWDEQVAELSEMATVVRYDVRGFGRSVRQSGDTAYTHASDLWCLLDHLSIDAAVLVGLSMGGRIVLEAALSAPERVRALVLLDAVLDGVPWDAESERGMEAIDAGLRSGGLAAAKAAWLDHGLFAPAKRSAEVARRLAQMVDEYSGVHWTDKDPHGPHPDTIQLLPSLQMPTTVVVGDLDVPCFIEKADVLAHTVPGARKRVIHDAGHMVNMETPETVNAILREVVLSVTGNTSTKHRSG